MPKILKAHIRDLLHDYRKQVFELEHADDQVAERTEKVTSIVGELLDQNFHYHLHDKDSERVEELQLIHNYCREALLPPVIERIVNRVLILENRHQIALELMARMLDALAEEEAATAS